MHEIIITPAAETNSLRKCGQRFTAEYKGQVLCVSETLFFDGARELLARNWARPDDMLTMRDAGSKFWAMRGRVGKAASLAIKQPSKGKAPQLAKFECYSAPEMNDAASEDAA